MTDATDGDAAETPAADGRGPDGRGRGDGHRGRPDQHRSRRDERSEREGGAKGEGRAHGAQHRSGAQPHGRSGRDGRASDRAPRRTSPTDGRTTRGERPPEPKGPPLPDDVTPHDLHPAARNELKTLSKENAETVARHLAMAARLVEDDPPLAHEHALAAVRRAGRLAVARETAAITAYATGDYALALRELRTYRRISGKDDQIALMVDSERGVGRPDRALELGRSVDRSALPTDVRVELAIAMSGARLDLGDAERALLELDIPELDPDRAFEWSPGLFAARAAVLEELGRDQEASEWRRRALVAAEALEEASGGGDLETVLVEEILEEAGETAGDDDPATSGGVSG